MDTLGWQVFEMLNIYLWELCELQQTQKIIGKFLWQIHIDFASHSWILITTFSFMLILVCLDNMSKIMSTFTTISSFCKFFSYFRLPCILIMLKHLPGSNFWIVCKKSVFYYSENSLIAPTEQYIQTFKKFLGALKGNTKETEK